MLLIAGGALSPDDALDAARDLAPTLGFLAAVLVLGDLCEREGLFAAAGRQLARRAAGSADTARRLLALVFALAAGVTVALGLDATVVLLTPVVLASAAALRLRARPHVFACVHLANAASLLLPVSNLTNLLAFHATDISFVRFAALMTLPWLAVLAVEWLVFTRFFADDLGAGAGAAREGATPATAVATSTAGAGEAPAFAAAVVALTLTGFVASSAIGVDPAFVAAAGAAVLAVRGLATGRARPLDILRATGPGFLLFVLGLGLVVAAAQAHGLEDVVEHVLPDGDALPALLAVCGLAALLANLINNLPATLILLPVLADRGVGPLLAALIGVNVGPNLTYTGSLATLLWRRHLRGRGADPGLATFTRLGVATVPVALVLGTVALWVGLQV